MGKVNLNRIKIFITAVILILANYLLYFKLSETFGYMGYEINSENKLVYLFSIPVCLLPLMFLRNRSDSDAVFFTIYYALLYIPIIVAFHMLFDFYKFLSHSAIFLTGFFLSVRLMQSQLKIPMFGLVKRIKTKRRAIILNSGLLFTLFLLGYLFLFNINNLSFYNLTDVYIKRRYLKFDTISGYSTLLITYFFAPIFISKGLILKRNLLVILGLILSILMFGFTGSKIALFSPAGIILVHVCIRLSRSPNSIFISLTNAFSMLILVLIAFYEKFGIFAAIILQRTFGNSGLLTYQYVHFFEKNPNTFLSHNSLFKYFYDYPYSKDLGVEVFNYFNNSDVESNSNANFLATDGIASFDILGILFISVVVGLYLNITKHQIRSELKLFTLMLVPFTILLTNISFFTILISGGWLFFNIIYIRKL